MTLDATSAATIRRLHFAEKWPVHTIATQLSVHPDCVRRIVGHLPADARAKPDVAALMGPYSDFVRETLARYPTLRATRVYDMLRGRGFVGSVRTVRRYLQAARPPRRGETFVRPQPLVGEQAQIDWMHAGRMRVDGGERDIWAFVMVLSYSRALWAELLFDLTAFAVRRSLLRAAGFFGGCTRQWLFDNPKTIVIARTEDTFLFHPLLLEVCGELCVQPRLCQVRRPQSKGRVERAVRYLRDRFLAGRTLRDLEADNAELVRFVQEIAPCRPHPELTGHTVADAFAQEKHHLLPLPSLLPILETTVPGRVDRYALVRFDSNRYSVPMERGAGPCTIAFDGTYVRILVDGVAVAEHLRCWGRKQIIELDAHRQGPRHRSPASMACLAHARMRRAAPQIDQLLSRWVAQGCNAGSMAARAVKLLDLYDAETFAAAVAALLETDLYDPSALAHLCDLRRAKQRKPVPRPMTLADHVVDADVHQHPLENYDAR